MLVLGIESTAHTFGIGLIEFERKKILFNEKIIFNCCVGMDLRKLSDFHTKNFDKILKKLYVFLSKKKIPFDKIDLISFSRGPGLGNSLKIGSLVAKTLSLKHKIPIIGVNHIISHFEVGLWSTKLEDPIFLNITGVNSQVVIKNKKKYYVFGETQDIGLGNLFDSIGRLFNLPFPQGPLLEKLALKGKKLYKIPYSLKGMDVSFSGIYSYVKNEYLKINKKSKKEKEQFIYDISYSLQETCFSMLLEICERAISYSNKKELVVVGGVASNKRFSQICKKMCRDRKIKYKATPLKLCMDNGVMIAVCGAINNSKKKNKINNLIPNPYARCEDGAVL